MGLDTIAISRRNEEERAWGETLGRESEEWEPAPDEPFAGINLCGGMLTGGPDSSSFRGKVYSEVIEDLTGESLYQDIIDPGVVYQMWLSLKDNMPSDDLPDDQSFGEYSYDVTVGEIRNLIKFFEVCADNGYGLHGWW